MVKICFILCLFGNFLVSVTCGFTAVAKGQRNSPNIFTRRVRTNKANMSYRKGIFQVTIFVQIRLQFRGMEENYVFSSSATIHEIPAKCASPQIGQ